MLYHELERVVSVIRLVSGEVMECHSYVYACKYVICHSHTLPYIAIAGAMAVVVMQTSSKLSHLISTYTCILILD